MFDAVIFENILSIFITSAILKLIQGMMYASILLVTDIIIWDKDCPYFVAEIIRGKTNSPFREGWLVLY